VTILNEKASHVRIFIASSITTNFTELEGKNQNDYLCKSMAQGNIFLDEKTAGLVAKIFR
jgi:hypothetical protein